MMPDSSAASRPGIASSWDAIVTIAWTKAFSTSSMSTSLRSRTSFSSLASLNFSSRRARFASNTLLPLDPYWRYLMYAWTHFIRSYFCPLTGGGKTRARIYRVNLLAESSSMFRTISEVTRVTSGSI